MSPSVVHCFQIRFTAELFRCTAAPIVRYRKVLLEGQKSVPFKLRKLMEFLLISSYLGLTKRSSLTNNQLFSSDEAHFWLNGYVNKQNCCIRSEANPQVYVETPLHPEKLTVWSALWAGGILLQKR
ncbi:hypothetical protein TNCV_136321 [Trichonephila clavipes]|nr:hypothetical protein TNCV_136321 [Trichonephila clavipes]